MMNIVAAQTSADAYTIQYSFPASQGLRKIRPELCAGIRQALAEIAEVAAYCASTPADDINTPLCLEVAGYVITYVMSDSLRVLIVLSVVPGRMESLASNG